MRRKLLAVMTLATAGALTLTACGGSSGGGSGGASGGGGGAKKVGVILPDSQSSARWETADRPFLKAAFDGAGIQSDIQNAQNDVSKFQSIATGMINSGVSALLIVSLDSKSAGTVIKKATDAGIPVIDYDRFNPGGGAKYYVSFDNVAVGTAIGTGLVKCLKDDGKTSGGVVELNGSPDDNNATLFKQGYDKVIKAAGYTIAADQAVPKWDNTTAGTLFDQIYTKTGGKFVGVAAANDGLGGAVIARLKTQGLAGKIPVTGQDATDEGLQRVLLGTQCVTVYKAVKKEAAAAADLAIKVIKGDTAGASSAATGVTKDTVTGKDVPSVLLTPQPIYKDNVEDVVKDGFTSAAKICTTAALKKACTANGVS
jgi:D-xylose transport system substrate-binding protein